MTGNHLFQRLRKKWRFVAIVLAAAAISFIIGMLLPGNQQGSDNPATAALQTQNLNQSLAVNPLVKEVGDDRTAFNLDRTVEELLTVLESKRHLQKQLKPLCN